MSDHERLKRLDKTFHTALSVMNARRLAASAVKRRETP
jgi:hypothetical protein